MQTSNKELILLVDDDPAISKEHRRFWGKNFVFLRLHLGKWHCHFFKSDTGSDPFGCKYAGNERI